VEVPDASNVCLAMLACWRRQWKLNTQNKRRVTEGKQGNVNTTLQGQLHICSATYRSTPLLSTGLHIATQASVSEDTSRRRQVVNTRAVESPPGGNLRIGACLHMQLSYQPVACGRSRKRGLSVILDLPPDSGPARLMTARVFSRRYTA